MIALRRKRSDRDQVWTATVEGASSNVGRDPGCHDAVNRQNQPLTALRLQCARCLDGIFHDQAVPGT